jgi:hypothetical protein
MIDPNEPQLAPPGAGLPKPELLIARLLFAWQRWRGNRESFNQHFQRERQLIQGHVASCDAESAARRVLIKRVPGLEDSSRYWSIWMTLEHLRIIHLQLAGIISSLANEVVPSGKADTAKVKPSPDLNSSVLAEYEASCDHLLKTTAAIGNLKTSARYPHPWFGSLDAAGWHAMAATHLNIHRQQIERIRAGLRAGRP